MKWWGTLVVMIAVARVYLILQGLVANVGETDLDGDTVGVALSRM